MYTGLTVVVSGGQCGADEGGLIAAERHGYTTGGLMPLGFKTKNGPRPDLAKRFGLVEHTSDSYGERTDINVFESDGTIRLAVNFNSPGEKRTLNAINRFHKPHIDVDMNAPLPARAVAEWIIANSISVLNVAGNAGCDEFRDLVADYLSEVFGILDG